MNPTVRSLEITVVVGSATPFATNEAPQLIARAVPSSLILNISLSKLAGAPDKFVVIVLIAAANAVIVTASQLSVLIVGVAELVIVVTRAVLRLFVKVWVSVVPTIVPLGAVTVVNADVPFPIRTPVRVPAPDPPRATLRVPVQPKVNDVALITAPVGVPPSVSVTFVSFVFVMSPSVPTPVPPRLAASVPVQPSVNDVDCRSAVVGVPPKVIVTFVSFVFVNAAGVIDAEAVHVGLDDAP